MCGSSPACRGGARTCSTCRLVRWRARGSTSPTATPRWHSSVSTGTTRSGSAPRPASTSASPPPRPYAWTVRRPPVTASRSRRETRGPDPGPAGAGGRGDLPAVPAGVDVLPPGRAGRPHAYRGARAARGLPADPLDAGRLRTGGTQARRPARGGHRLPCPAGRDPRARDTAGRAAHRETARPHYRLFAARPRRAPLARVPVAHDDLLRRPRSGVRHGARPELGGQHVRAGHAASTRGSVTAAGRSGAGVPPLTRRITRSNIAASIAIRITS